MSNRFCNWTFGPSPVRALVFAVATASACSLQDFDYLKDESTSGGAVGTGGVRSSGGSETARGGTVATSGGGPARGGSGGSNSHEAGASGAGGDGGEGNSEGGAGNGEGGAGGASGGGDAGTSSGGVVNEGGQAGSANGGTGGRDVSGGTGGGGAPPVGNLLQNPSFELDLQNWTVDPAAAVTNRYVFVQFPTSGGTTKDGAKELATWHETSEYSIFVYQTVKNLVPGTYALKGWFSSTQSRGVYLFARNCGSTEQQQVVPTNAFTWFEISIPAVEVTGSTCEVGVFIHNVAQDWVNADAFSFEKVP